ncbi:MAG: preprotein translocase subunit SecY, partial [Chloroflexi bacterium]
MIQAVRNAFTLPDLRRKLLFTLAILIIYRLAAHVPVPGVNQTALKNLLQGGGAGGQLVGLLDILSGGAVATFSVMAMGVYPYITASIIFQLLVPIIPNLEQMLKEEGEEGRRKLERYTYYLTVPLAALQAIGQVRLFGSLGGEPILPNFGFSGPKLLPTFATIAAMTAGTMFAIWLGELISEQGIGNGVSLIIFGGIVARIPRNVANILVQ